MLQQRNFETFLLPQTEHNLECTASVGIKKNVFNHIMIIDLIMCIPLS